MKGTVCDPASRIYNEEKCKELMKNRNNSNMCELIASSDEPSSLFGQLKK